MIGDRNCILDKWSGYDSKELLERRGLDASQLKALSQMADRRGSSPMDYNSPSPQGLVKFTWFSVVLIVSIRFAR